MMPAGGSQSPTVAAALAYAARGWRVFPLQPAVMGVKESGKRPITAHGVKDAASDPEKVAEWWASSPDANVGLACGREFVVVDIDTATPPPPFDTLPDTLIARTGRGLHVYLDPSGEVFPNRTGVAPGVDVRSEGGYVVAPPSLHYTGAVYSWTGPSKLAPIPPAWLAFMRKAPLEAAPPPVMSVGSGGNDAERARAYLRAIPGAVSGQGGHAATFTAAQAMVRGFGLSEGDALALLVSDFNPRCDPPWSARELQHKVASASAQGTMAYGSLRDAERVVSTSRFSAPRRPEPPLDAYDDDSPPDFGEPVPIAPEDPPPGGEPEPTGAPDGEPKRKRKKPKPTGTIDGSHEGIQQHVMAGLASARGPIVYDEGAFWSYADGVWSQIPLEPDLWGAIQSLNGALTLAGEQISVTAGLVESVLKLAKATHTRKDFFATAPAGLAFSDGFLAAGATLVPHDAEHRCRHQFPFSYHDAREASADRWFQALDEWGLSEAQQAFIGEWVGACLIGIITADPRALIITGGGEEGKSVAIDTIEGLFPADWRSHIGMQDLSGQFAMVDLVGKRLNSVSDASGAEFHDTSKFKLVSAGGACRAEQKYRPTFNFVPVAGHLFSFNELPRVRDDTHGFWRRASVVPFTRKVDAARRVDRLQDQLLETERMGIVGWALEHAAAKVKRGHFTPIETDAVDEWRKTSNPVEMWRDECTEPEGWTSASEVYEHFASWAKRMGFTPPSASVFGPRLKRLVGPDGWKLSNGVKYAMSLKSTMSLILGGRR